MKDSLDVNHYDFGHLVALFDGVYDVLTFDNLAENGMMTVQPRTRNVSDEELRTIGVRTGVRHRQCAGAVVAKVGMEFVFKRITRSSRSISSRIPALDHKIANNAVENETVIETAVGKFLEISDCFRSFIGEQFEFNRSARGLNRCDFFHFKHIPL